MKKEPLMKAVLFCCQGYVLFAATLQDDKYDQRHDDQYGDLYTGAHQC
jgi:hypothetical protein